ncbi:hypothetical protein H4Q26_015052 [Puccinia striiformis f. sp. tritici PST-130]|nr:hypothetical protein H4Q26_015052 [Puccinia striiformis f. sp. tritici PST-130]
MGFWGGRNRWSSYFLTGAYIGALLVMTPILRFGVMDQDHSPSNAIQGVFVLACFISAVGAGAVAVIFWKVLDSWLGVVGVSYSVCSSCPSRVTRSSQLPVYAGLSSWPPSPSDSSLPPFPRSRYM